MADFLRLISAVLVAVFSLSAHALVPEVATYRASSDYASAAYPSRQAAADAYCARALPVATATDTYKCGPLTQNAQSVWFVQVMRCPKAGGACLGGDAYTIVQTGPLRCPDHSISVTGGCKCDTGYVEQDGQCKTPGSVCADKASQPAIPPGVHQEFDATKAAPGAMFAPRKVCIDACQATGTPSYWACGGTKCLVYFEKAAYTGQACSGDGAGTTPESDTKPIPPPERCPDGKVPGSVNGTSVCVTPGEAGAASGTTGSTSTTGTKADGTAAPGSSTGTGTTSSTNCDGADCTTTTTRTTSTTDGSGQTSTQQETTTKKESQLSHCAANPKAKECVGSEDGKSGFSGTCSAGYVAKSDDAVLNAMAEEQYRRNCETLSKTNDDSAWVLAERDRTTDRTADNPNNRTVSLSAGDIDTSDALGGARCIADKVVQVAGSSVALPFSKVCGSLELLGNVLLGVTLLAAAGIVLRG